VSGAEAGSRRVRRRPVVVVAAVVVAGTAGLGAARVRGAGSEPASVPPATSALPKTATVARADLVERLTVDGTLSYGDSRALASPRPGTLTWLPPVGTTVDRGQPLARVDERTVPLFIGTVPLHRDLTVGVDDGEDVRQLEENLVALGHGIDGLVVDAHYDWATRAAVQAWQRANGATVTGAVGRTDVVVAPTAVRVAEHKGEVGQNVGPGQPLVTVTGTDRSVTVALAVARQALANVGDAVEIEMPDHRSTTGHITAVSTVAQVADSDAGGGDSDPTIPVTISLDDPAVAGRLDRAPVSVRITERQATGVLVVPVKALLALQEGGYAVEVVDTGLRGPNAETGGARRYVPVQTGAFAGGRVEITGSVQPGDTVVVAS
jgi:peptidoglycan hydrolase-like protein with peptidoglycan-binding domain